jgi:hypothetical protein
MSSCVVAIVVWTLVKQISQYRNSRTLRLSTGMSSVGPSPMPWGITRAYVWTPINRLDLLSRSGRGAVMRQFAAIKTHNINTNFRWLL